MPNVYCDSCGYRYSHNQDKPLPKKCPYCDSKGSIRLVKTAQDWLDEVSRV